MVDLIVKSKVKEYAKEKGGVAVSEGYYTRKEEKFKASILEDIERAKQNKRNTLKPRDC